MNTYKAFYRDKTAMVNAETSAEAQRVASTLLRAKKRHEVTVMLVEKDGKPYTHSTAGV